MQEDLNIKKFKRNHIIKIFYLLINLKNSFYFKKLNDYSNNKLKYNN